jgi:hypothetical protein
MGRQPVGERPLSIIPTPSQPSSSQPKIALVIISSKNFAIAPQTTVAGAQKAWPHLAPRPAARATKLTRMVAMTTARNRWSAMPIAAATAANDLRGNGGSTMSSKRLVFFILFAILTANSSAQESSDHKAALADSGRRVLFDGQAFWGRETAIPEWHNGFLVAREIETFKEDETNVRLFDQTGTKVSEAAIWFPGSARIFVEGAAATLDGRIVAVGEANKADGTTGHFLVTTNKNGTVTQVIQTQGFYPGSVCVAPDDTIWSFGSTGYDRSEPRPGNTLRHFDMDKGQIGSFLPRSAFPRKVVPDELSYIRCSATEVVAYSPRTSKYIEMKYNAGAPHVYEVSNAPSNLKLIGFASLGHQQVFGLFNMLAHYGMYELKFNDTTSTATWIPVDGTQGESKTEAVVIGLWGSDPDGLIVSRSQDSGGLAALHWAKVMR